MGDLAHKTLNTHHNIATLFRLTQAFLLFPHAGLTARIFSTQALPHGEIAFQYSPAEVLVREEIKE